MSLDRYLQKRNFARTPEPAPGAGGLDGPRTSPEGPSAPGGCGRFVIHRHRASRLHYDLRLEVDGVLASWALPKGPTRDPEEKRFAARTEDHPIEYLDFEGVIPMGEYGAGDSICWDWGTFEPELTWDPGEALRAGELKLRLRGEKLAGRFTLVRTAGTGESWLLIAKAGPEAIPGWDPESVPASVRTGRTNEEVKAGLAPLVDHPAPAALPSLDPPGARVAAQPTFVEPMLATPGTAPFDDADWLFEPKWDGYRIQAIISGGSVALRTRNRNNAGRLFPELLGKPAWLAAPEAIVDGEVVVLDAEGRPDFGLLQARLGGGFSASDVAASGPAREAGRTAPLVFMAFDLLWCAGRSYLDVPLEIRKAILRLVLRDHPRVRFGGHVERDGVAFFAAAAAQGLEGAMAKHRRSRYEAGHRSAAWLKLKVRPTQELVVAGYVPGQGSHRDLGALIVGVMEAGHLRYAGRVGSGLDAATRARLRAAIDARARATAPFDAPPDELARTPDAIWAEPALVIRAEIGGWSRDGIVRQASFAQEAPEVDPVSVERQTAVGPEAAARALAKAGVGRGPSSVGVRRQIAGKQQRPAVGGARRPNVAAAHRPDIVAARRPSAAKARAQGPVTPPSTGGRAAAETPRLRRRGTGRRPPTSSLRSTRCPAAAGRGRSADEQCR